MFLLCFVITILIAGSQAKSLADRQAGCQTFCPLIFMPVCGSDGQTYSNNCDLNVHACLQAEQFSNEPDFNPLTAAYQGVCGRKTEKRQFTESGCPMFCTLQYAPVCGSDGVTYGNPCQLNTASCLSAFNHPEAEPITLAQQGGCNGEGIFPLLDIGPVMVS